MTTIFRPATLMILLAACSGDLGDDDADAQSGADTTETTSTTQALMAVSADAAGSATSDGAAAMAAAQGASTFFQPAGCLTTARNGATVTYTFANCTGPYGLVNVNGTVNATYSEVTATSRTITVSGEVRVNRFVHRPDATARVTFMGGTRTAMVTVRGTGTSPRGVAYTNSGSYMSSWDGACFGISGRVTSTTAQGSVSVDIASYRRCRGGCPESGGRISLSSSRGASLTVSYPGGATATITGSRGRTSTVALFCGG